MGTDGFTNSGNETSDDMNRNSNNNDDSNQVINFYPVDFICFLF